MIDFGTVRPGTTLYIPFSTYDSNDPSASVTITGLATTDIEIYKNGSTTQRASDNGYALLDTDGIDFDGQTGLHGFSIDLADNSDAGFYAAGAQYWVWVASITVDGATVNFRAATFRIGYPTALLNTTIATLASQTSFTLTAGPAEDDALNGMWCMIHDVASAVQCGYAVISDYTGASKTVTLAAGTTFTAAATDNIAIMGPMPLQPTVAARALDVSSGGEAGLDWANIGSPTTAVNLSGTTVKTATDVETDTADIQSRLPTTLTGDGNMKADTLRVGGTLQTAGDLAAMLTAIDDFIDTEMAAVLQDTGTDIPALIAALNDLSAAEVNAEVVDALATDAYAEPTGVPAASATLAVKLGVLYMALRNRVDVTSTKMTFYDDGGAAEFEKDLSDDGTTYSESEVNAI